MKSFLNDIIEAPLRKIIDDLVIENQTIREEGYSKGERIIVLEEAMQEFCNEVKKGGGHSDDPPDCFIVQTCVKFLKLLNKD